MPVKLVTIFLSMALALAALTGCSAPHMHPATPRAIVPDPAAATVVFVRPSVLGAAITPVIATTAGRFLGETEARSYFVTKLPPGTYTFLSWSESTPAMQATLAPGLVYYVEVDPRMGFGSARVQLLALGPRRGGWSKLVDWLLERAPDRGRRGRRRRAPARPPRRLRRARPRRRRVVPGLLRRGPRRAHPAGRRRCSPGDRGGRRGPDTPVGVAIVTPCGPPRARARIAG